MELNIENRLTLKWGSLKSYKFASAEAQELIKEYNEIVNNFSLKKIHPIACDKHKAGTLIPKSQPQKCETPRQKEIICELIDLCDGNTIYIHWYGKHVPKDEAKEYIMNYD